MSSLTPRNVRPTGPIELQLNELQLNELQLNELQLKRLPAKTSEYCPAFAQNGTSLQLVTGHCGTS
ncbi:MAG: hypothetical protein CBB71_21370 [Rhodopirellula sp. TMED11]|nr:MAG: hypothetical protein CBB71_21370 [Rhodopirellula sp. TMED11]